MTIDRRSLLALPLAGLVPASVLANNGTVIRRPIPKSIDGEQLPAIGLGTSQAFDAAPGDERWGNLDGVLDALAESGATLVDTSPMYGRAETALGELLAGDGYRGDLFYATKVWTDGRQSGLDQMAASARKMGVERIDLMQVHNLRDLQTHLASCRQLKDEGFLRYIGITHYVDSAHDDLMAVMAKEDIDFVQVNYSIAETAAADELLPMALDRGIAVLVNRPFARGNLFGRLRSERLPEWAAEFDCASWAQFLLKYILANPAVTNIIPRTSKPKHAVDNCMAGFGALPTRQHLTKMRELVANL